MKINKDRFITVMKIINDEAVPASVKLFYQSDLLLLRESTNKFKYSICLNRGCKPVLMSLNNKNIASMLCKYTWFISNNLTISKLFLKLNLTSISIYYSFYGKWTCHD